jgi:RNA polymerase sigma factor (sigma-70 family)
MAERVRAALQRLAEPHRQVIQLRRFEEREVPEIAAIMDRSENAVRVLYCRALQALKAELGGP